MNTLSQAIEQLYAAFADVPKPRAIVGCPCCLDNKDIDTLLATPLREIGPRDLSPYASSAFLTVGRRLGLCLFSAADSGDFRDRRHVVA